MADARVAAGAPAGRSGAEAMTAPPASAFPSYVFRCYRPAWPSTPQREQKHGERLIRPRGGLLP